MVYVQDKYNNDKKIFIVNTETLAGKATSDLLKDKGFEEGKNLFSTNESSMDEKTRAAVRERTRMITATVNAIISVYRFTPDKNEKGMYQHQRGKWDRHNETLTLLVTAPNEQACIDMAIKKIEEDCEKNSAYGNPYEGKLDKIREMQIESIQELRPDLSNIYMVGMHDSHQQLASEYGPKRLDTNKSLSISCLQAVADNIGADLDLKQLFICADDIDDQTGMRILANALFLSDAEEQKLENQIIEMWKANKERVERELNNGPEERNDDPKQAVYPFTHGAFPHGAQSYIDEAGNEHIIVDEFKDADTPSMQMDIIRDLVQDPLPYHPRVDEPEYVAGDD